MYQAVAVSLITIINNMEFCHYDFLSLELHIPLLLSMEEEVGSLYSSYEYVFPFHGHIGNIEGMGDFVLPVESTDLHDHIFPCSMNGGLNTQMVFSSIGAIVRGQSIYHESPLQPSLESKSCAMSLMFMLWKDLMAILLLYRRRRKRS